MSELRWQQAGQFAQRSVCDTYSVCAVRAGGRLSYEAWRTRQHVDGPKLLQPALASAEIARMRCEEDLHEPA